MQFVGYGSMVEVEGVGKDTLDNAGVRHALSSVQPAPALAPHFIPAAAITFGGSHLQALNT